MGCTTGVHFPAGIKMGFLLFATESRPPLGPTQPAIQRVPVVTIPVVQRPRQETDYSHLSIAEAKKAWSYTSTPIRLHGVAHIVRKHWVSNRSRSSGLWHRVVSW